MKLRKIGYLISVIFLFLMVFSVPAHPATEGEKQEALGRAIQEAALLSQHRSAGAGFAQEKLGQAIQEAASTGLTAKEGALQEELGRQIQDAAVLRYAQGQAQERIGETLLQMARS